MKATCPICPHRCNLEEGQLGICRARKNVNGEIICENYGKLTAVALDPIEKKPLARFFPGSQILSAGSFGCNLRCGFCQNHHISMTCDNNQDTTFFPPETLARHANALRDRGNIGLAYTYNEPLVGFEYVLDCAQIIRNMGMKNILVTNGYIEEGPLRKLLPFIDAMNIDLKGFTESFYRGVGGDLASVKRSIALAASYTHVEVTTLIIPEENDSDNEMDQLASWLSGIRDDIPFHISRFFPRYHYSHRPATSVDAIYHLSGIARNHLKFVYPGNC